MRLWHTLGLEDVLKELNTSDRGLDDAEVQARLARFGLNELRARSEPLWKKIIEPFTSIFVLILLAAAVVSFATGENLDGYIISAIIAINAAIYYTQRQATERVLKSLKRHNEQSVIVVRNGRDVETSSRWLVPGDLLILSEGLRVPADARLFKEDILYTDESALTGESLPIKKTVATEGRDRPLYERTNMVFQGTYVLSGTARAVVVETGMSTEFGKIAELATRDEPASPMQTKINTIVSRLIKVLAGVAVLVFGLALLRGIAPDEALRFVLAMSVSAVPEDLPIALSVVLVLGMRRLARKNALVRSMKTMEDIGIVTVVAVDKTGTLTKNNLKVVTGWSLDPKIDLKEAAFKSLGGVSSVAEPFDKALLAVTEHGSAYSGKHQKNYPFEQAQRLSGALWQEGSESELYIKGAPEHVLGLCRLESSDQHSAMSQLYGLTARGYRVIAMAKASISNELPNLKNIQQLNFQLLGLIAFADELRPESAHAVAQARQAGVEVKMITGDHFETAFHIGQLVGICSHKDEVVLGSDLPVTEDELANVVKIKTVFARILPDQKFRILKALKRNHITAMTGDGVNDVPALASAEVGIAMGSGNDIAKDAGDILLLDNNFSSIVNAISEGRVIYDNIRRMLFYLLSTSLGELVTIVGALLFALPLPVSAVQVLWINLVTDTSLVIPLGLEPPENDHMNKPPRPPRAPILDRLILSRIVLVGAVMAVVALGTFAYLISEGYSDEYARSVAFMMLVAAQWANAFNARSEHHSLLRRLKTPNYKLLVGLSLAIVLQALVMLGPLRETFGVVDVNTSHLLVSIFLPIIAVLVAVELHKVLVKPKTMVESS
ncbi:hypothetical protein A3B63_00325 [Candidatus Saccharibacteria bacterium RIFCSPLOWO2_01_FULL_49_22]|nr:MAG: hypothetical protein A3B63_00325 [Candidatus Saccharibacteria bacterium RIFCSPLOWO2_01_FULL_49_22]